MTQASRSTAFTLLPMLACSLAAQNDPRQTGPATLVIEYRCPPGQRVQLRQAAMGSLPRLEAWKNDNVLASYRILFSRYVNTNNWDMLTILTFRSYADVARWKEVERLAPAGLPSGGLAATSAIYTYPADSVRRKTDDTDPAQPVYLVVPYTIEAAPDAYLRYVDDYMRPQFEGWMREGALTGYEVFLQRYTASRPWDSLLLLRYKDEASLGLRESVVAKVRRELQNDPAWKSLSDNKRGMRTEKEVVIADELAPSVSH
jgi:hypothetical protein